MPRRLVVALCAALLALHLLVDEGGSAPLALLAAAGLVVGARERSWRGAPRLDRWLFGALVAFFLLSLVQLWRFGATNEALRILENHRRLLQLVPLVWLFRRLRPSARELGWMLCLGALANLAWALYEVRWLGRPRAVGANNFIQFGTVNLLYAGSLALLALRAGSRGGGFLLLAGAACAAGACVLSSTRGAWLAAPVYLALAWLAWRGGTGRGRSLRAPALAAGVLAVLATAALLAPGPGARVRERLSVGWEEAAAWFERPDERAARTSSVGLRLEMWRAAAKAAAERPLLGAGLDGYAASMRRLVDEGAAVPEVLEKLHPHDEYLAVWLRTGVVGLLLLGAATGAWALGVARGARAGEPLAWVGLGVLGSYLVFALTNAVLDRGISISPLVFFAALTYAASVPARAPRSELVPAARREARRGEEAAASAPERAVAQEVAP